MMNEDDDDNCGGMRSRGSWLIPGGDDDFDSKDDGGGDFDDGDDGNGDFNNDDEDDENDGFD